jgi:glycosyltransferase involved in cell wall biosynthesis
MIGYGTHVGSWEKLPRYVIPRVGHRPLVVLSGQPSIAVAYNTILDAYKGKSMDAVVLLHDDLEITDPAAEAKFLAAFEDPDVALVGVAGGGPALRWWDHDPIGHQMTDSGLLDFGRRAGGVDMVEGSIVAFSPWAVENLRCDERYTDFRSGWDDVCLHARAAGKRVVVADVDTHHHSTIGWKSPEIEARFVESERMFREKWAA